MNANQIRKSIAVFHHDGIKWVMVRGIKGTEVLGTFKTLTEVSNACQQFNESLRKEVA